SRNPKIETGTSAEFVNNVIYNWGDSVSHTTNIGDTKNTGEAQFLNFIGNYYKPGPDSGETETIYARGSLNTKSRIYVVGNISPSRPTDSLAEWKIIGFLDDNPFQADKPAITPQVHRVTPAA